MPFVKGHKGMGGRPKGSTTKVVVKDLFTKKEFDEFWRDLKERAKTNDKIALYFAEQMSGKATQPISGDEENPITVKIVGMKIIDDTKNS